jgi:hypothetical protein
VKPSPINQTQKEMKHKHAENMLAFAQDAMETETPWERWEHYCCIHEAWVPIHNSPLWSELSQYRRKPRTININGIEVPEPVREPLERGTTYYMPCIQPYSAKETNETEWLNDECDHCWLKAGIIHLTEEAAATHTKALLSFTQK